MKPLFIVIEGIDGCGGSTQATLLHEYFLSKKQPAIVTSEPSSGPIGSLIRLGFNRRVDFANDPHLFDMQMAYLFAADRHDHLYNERDGVFTFLNQGKHVISTRYYFSSLAYHCSSKSDTRFVSRLNEAFPTPNILIYLDNPVEVSLQRIQHRKIKDIYEIEKKLRAASSNYRRILSRYADPLLLINATQSPVEIHKHIVEFIEKERHD